MVALFCFECLLSAKIKNVYEIVKEKPSKRYCERRSLERLKRVPTFLKHFWGFPPGNISGVLECLRS